MLCLKERTCFIIGIAQAESIICNDMDIQHKDISGAHNMDEIGNIIKDSVNHDTLSLACL